MQLDLAEIAAYPNVMENLRLDVTPEDIFRPRYKSQPDYHEISATSDGYFFYVEITEKGPELMIMKNYGQNSKTLGEVAGVPIEHLHRITAAPDAREMGGMYAIDEELKSWLREKLGIPS